jgi:hypothetical protein
VPIVSVSTFTLYPFTFSFNYRPSESACKILLGKLPDLAQNVRDMILSITASRRLVGHAL